MLLKLVLVSSATLAHAGGYKYRAKASLAPPELVAATSGTQKLFVTAKVVVGARLQNDDTAKSIVLRSLGDTLSSIKDKVDVENGEVTVSDARFWMPLYPSEDDAPLVSIWASVAIRCQEDCNSAQETLRCAVFRKETAFLVVESVDILPAAKKNTMMQLSSQSGKEVRVTSEPFPVQPMCRVALNLDDSSVEKRKNEYWLGELPVANAGCNVGPERWSTRKTQMPLSCRSRCFPRQEADTYRVLCFTDQVRITNKGEATIRAAAMVRERQLVRLTENTAENENKIAQLEATEKQILDEMQTQRARVAGSTEAELKKQADDRLRELGLKMHNNAEVLHSLRRDISGERENLEKLKLLREFLGDVSKPVTLQLKESRLIEAGALATTAILSKETAPKEKEEETKPVIPEESKTGEQEGTKYEVIEAKETLTEAKKTKPTIPLAVKKVSEEKTTKAAEEETRKAAVRVAEKTSKAPTQKEAQLEKVPLPVPLDAVFASLPLILEINVPPDGSVHEDVVTVLQHFPLMHKIMKDDRVVVNDLSFHAVNATLTAWVHMKVTLWLRDEDGGRRREIIQAMREVQTRSLGDVEGLTLVKRLHDSTVRMKFDLENENNLHRIDAKLAAIADASPVRVLQRECNATFCACTTLQEQTPDAIREWQRLSDSVFGGRTQQPDLNTVKMSQLSFRVQLQRKHNDAVVSPKQIDLCGLAALAEFDQLQDANCDDEGLLRCWPSVQLPHRLSNADVAAQVHAKDKQLKLVMREYKRVNATISLTCVDTAATNLHVSSVESRLTPTKLCRFASVLNKRGVRRNKGSHCEVLEHALMAISDIVLKPVESETALKLNLSRRFIASSDTLTVLKTATAKAQGEEGTVERGESEGDQENTQFTEATVAGRNTIQEVARHFGAHGEVSDSEALASGERLQQEAQQGKKLPLWGWVLVLAIALCALIAILYFLLK
ncbi:MAG: hypothetical protein MHM6MM_004200 [Cercozoa sp. M6MM]